MSDIQRYTGNPNNFQELCSMADQLAKSGFFPNTVNSAQAVSKALLGMELGLGLATSMKEIHIIEGKTVISSYLYASFVKKSKKYDYKVLEKNDKVCEVQIIEVATKEVLGSVRKEFKVLQDRGVINSWNKDTKQFELKSNWKRYPENMLFARAISDAVKFFCPDVFNTAVYVADEFDVEVDENETPIQPKQANSKQPEYAAFEPVTPPTIQAPAPVQPEPLTPEQVADKVNALVGAFEAKGIDKLQIKVTTGKDITEINEADIAILRAMYKELVANPAPDKFELMAKYKTIFQDAN